MTQLGSPGRPLRVAVAGSGPAGFYAAEALLKSGVEVRVDLVDRLPTPFGLVRAGVAPDHQKLKTVIRVYEQLATDPRIGFLGNVTVGRDLSVGELRRHYDALIVASGAETDRRLGIPGEDLGGSHTATEFVGWYNGHPDYQDRVFDLSGEAAVVVGQGNVAMDVSRILAKTVDELKGTDITERALDVLAASRIREIHVIGRRGPAQAKFTPPEIKEIGDLADCDPRVDAADLELGPACRAEVEDAKNLHARRNLQVLESYVPRNVAKARTYHLRFFLSPVELAGEGRVDRVVLERNRLEGEPFHQRAVGTGERLTLPCHLLFRSVGYRGVPVPGIPFDERTGVIPNRAGRVQERDGIVPGLYAAGWIKRGPSGVIGTNKPDGVETVGSLLADLPTLVPCPDPSTEPVMELLRSRGIRPVSFDDWHTIDQAEIERGKAKGKPREKFTRIEEMLALLD